MAREAAYEKGLLSNQAVKEKSTHLYPPRQIIDRLTESIFSAEQRWRESDKSE
jgi:hypothetical protein